MMKIIRTNKNTDHLSTMTSSQLLFRDCKLIIFGQQLARSNLNELQSCREALLVCNLLRTSHLNLFSSTRLQKKWVALLKLQSAIIYLFFSHASQQACVPHTAVEKKINPWMASLDSLANINSTSTALHCKVWTQGNSWEGKWHLRNRAKVIR